MEAAVAISLHLVMVRIQLEAMADTWKVARLLEILPTTSRVPGYSEKPVTRKIDSSLII
jgi:hypothetical protein